MNVHNSFLHNQTQLETHQRSPAGEEKSKLWNPNLAVERNQLGDMETAQHPEILFCLFWFLRPLSCPHLPSPLPHPCKLPVVRSCFLFSILFPVPSREPDIQRLPSNYLSNERILLLFNVREGSYLCQIGMHLLGSGFFSHAVLW